jgi:DNA-binding SARP family transcriptional activator
MAELTLISQDSGSLKPFVEGTISEALYLTETGIQRTEQRLQEFEGKYKLSSQEFLQHYEDGEFLETLDFDEWIGEIQMLHRLQEKV